MARYSPSLSVCYDLSTPVLSLACLTMNARVVEPLVAVWTSSSAVTRAMSNINVTGSV